MKTKKDIIEIMKQYDKATIAFSGLSTIVVVDKAKEIIIAHWNNAIKEYKTKFPDCEINLVVSDTMVVAGGKFQFLPNYPITGKLQIRSKDFIIGKCFCDFIDIIPKTYKQTEKTIAFQTKAGNTVLITK